jgi:sec-independent protein translocase protein TatA
MPGLDHWWIILLILVVVLVIWGPGKMPDVGAGLGRAIHEFRSAVSGGQDSVGAGTTRPAAQWTPVPEDRPPVTVPDDTQRG